MIGSFILSLVTGFLSAAIMHKIFWHVLRFRAEWTSTFIACMLTCFVAGLAFTSAMLCFDSKDEHQGLKVFGTSFAIALIAGLLAFRLIVKSESGRTLNWLTSGLAALALCLPPLLLLSAMGLMWPE